MHETRSYIVMDISCSLCGRTGSWPFIPFDELDPIISSRPSDVAAIVARDPVEENVMYALSPNVMDKGGVRYDCFCPKCYRIGETPEENGVDVVAAAETNPAEWPSLFTDFYIPADKSDVEPAQAIINLFHQLPLRVTDGASQGHSYKIHTPRSQEMVNTITYKKNFEVEGEGICRGFVSFELKTHASVKGKFDGFFLSVDIILDKVPDNSTANIYKDGVNPELRIKLMTHLIEVCDRFAADVKKVGAVKERFDREASSPQPHEFVWG